MDPPPYKPPAGLPQESKLVTYMNRPNTAPARPLSQAMAGLSLDDSSSANLQIREFVPMNYYAPPTMMPESPGGSPPSVLATHMGGGLPQMPYMGAGMPQNLHMGGVIPQSSHMGGVMPQSSHMGSGILQSSHMGGVMPQSSHMGNGMPQSLHMGGVHHHSSLMGSGMLQGSHMGSGMPQGSHMGSVMPQSSHMGSVIPQTSLMGSGMPHSSLMGSGMPQNSYMGGLVHQNSHIHAGSHVNAGGHQNSHMSGMPPSHMGGNMHMPTQPTQMIQENVGGTTYFFPSDSINPSASLHASAEAACLGIIGPPILVPSPYATQMYIPMPTHMQMMPTKPGLAATFYHPDTVLAEVYERNETVFLSQQDLSNFPVDIPEYVDIYAELIPLEGVAPHSMSSSYRVTHRQTCEYFAMRRLHSYGTSAPKRLDLWKQIDHPNVVMMHDYMTTNAFGDHSIALVYSFHPAGLTLMNKYLVGCGNPSSDGTSPFHDPFSSDPDAPRPYTHQKNAMLRTAASGNLLPEPILWSLIVQLTAGLRAIHSAGLACRNLDPSKVIMHGCRARIAWPGIMDALHPNVGDIQLAQQEDMTALGRLAMSLACRTPHCDNMQASIDLVTRSYSPDLKNIIMYLISGQPARRTISDLMPMIGARFYTQVEALQRRSDILEELLAMEIDNGRLFRLLVKLATCNERTEVHCDPVWAETGHRYLLKLFRDYVFHAVTPDGRPWIDQAHVVNCLNLLDGGATNRVPLISRDEQSVLVVTYSELKHSLEASFEEIMQAAAGP